MISLSAKIRNDLGKKTKNLKEQGMIPAVVYGPKIKNINVEVAEKEFRQVFKETGESSLVELLVEGKKSPVLIHEIQKDPVSDAIIHLDFLQPDLTEKIEVAVPLVFEGVAKAEKDLGGTLVKNIQEVEVKALPQNLPQEILVDISVLNTFEDHILIKDLKIPENVEIVKNLDEIVASVLEPKNMEEDLDQPIEENVENVEQVKKEKKEEVVEE